MPYPVQKQMIRRTRELSNKTESVQEAKHGFRGSVIDLTVNHNRSYLLDALQLPLLSFRSKLRNPARKITMLRFHSRVTGKNYMMQVVHRSGFPTSQRYRQEDYFQHLANDIHYDSGVCVLSRADDDLLYSLTGKLYRSIGKSFSAGETKCLMIMRNALARMFVKHV